LRLFNSLLFVQILIKLSFSLPHTLFFLELVHLLDSFGPRLRSYVHQQESIFYQAVLDEPIKRRVGNKGWSVVDLQDIRFTVFIKHDVDSQYVKAHISVLIIWLAKAILVSS
jgi:hypothetical protein